MEDAYRQFLMEGERAGMRYALEIPHDAMRGATGIQLGQAAGSSVDFKDYREYEPGDDLRRIDWSVYGRTDKLIVKLYREEVSPHLDVLLDCSRSMALPGTDKIRGLLGTAGLLATAATNSKCSHAAWMISDGYMPVGNGHAAPSVWEGIWFDSTRNPAEAFDMMPARLRPHGIRVLISDLLWMGDPMLSLRPIAEGAASLVVIQLLARSDADPRIRGNTRLIDMETGEPLEVFVDAVAEQNYRDALGRHQQNWHRACRQVGATMTTLVAEDIAVDWRLPQLEAAQIVGAA